MDKLDIIYICDDGFAEVAGVSIVSLFEKNPREKIQLTVYLLGVGLTEENRQGFENLGLEYGQEVVLIDATEEYKEIQKLNLSVYRGSAMTNLRLHFDKLLPQTVKKILYIDCDTIICDELNPLCEFSLNGKLLAMALDAYGKMLVQEEDEVYYNAGVLLIDCDKWRLENWRGKIETFIENNTKQLAHPDQDVFNRVCRNEITRLPIRYNLQVIHREYSEQLYFYYLAPRQYYSQQEIKEARENPAIIHMIRSMGTNPWYLDGKEHPDYEIYRYYKNKSSWKTQLPQPLEINFVIRCERILKKILPKGIFFPISLMAMKMANKNGNNKY